MKSSRVEVYRALDGERQYQDARWNSATTNSGGWHEPEAFLLYIEHYVGLARTVLSTKNVQEAYPEAQHIFRKIAALAIAEMEQHGAPSRVYEVSPPVQTWYRDDALAVVPSPHLFVPCGIPAHVHCPLFVPCGIPALVHCPLNIVKGGCHHFNLDGRPCGKPEADHS